MRRFNSASAHPRDLRRKHSLGQAKFALANDTHPAPSTGTCTASVFNADWFDSVYPKYAGGRPRTGAVGVACLDGAIVGTAIWLPPGHWIPTLAEQLRSLPGFARAFGKRMRQAGAMEQAMVRAHPREPHWYLESTEAANVPLYQHFGFEPTGPMALPDGAPVITPMWRPAAVAVGNDVNSRIHAAVVQAQDWAKRQWPGTNRYADLAWTAPDGTAWAQHQPLSSAGSWIFLNDTWIHPNKAGAGQLAQTVTKAMCSAFGHWCNPGRPVWG
jgi:hypothetical protein